MEYKVDSVTNYLEEIPEDRREGFSKLIETIKINLPQGFEEQICYGHITYVVPFSIYPDGYHCDKNQALPFITVASQKNHIAIYHMGIYMNAEILEWFQNEFPKHSKKKLNMGKSCIRFSKTNDIPYDLIAELATKMTVDEYVNLYTSLIKK